MCERRSPEGRAGAVIFKDNHTSSHSWRSRESVLVGVKFVFICPDMIPAFWRDYKTMGPWTQEYSVDLPSLSLSRLMWLLCCRLPASLCGYFVFLQSHFAYLWLFYVCLKSFCSSHSISYLFVAVCVCVFVVVWSLFVIIGRLLVAFLLVFSVFLHLILHLCVLCFLHLVVVSLHLHNCLIDSLLSNINSSSSPRLLSCLCFRVQ